MAPTTTKDDQQVAAALEIRSISSSLKQFNNSLEEAIKILINPNGFSQAKKTRAAKELKELKARLINSANQLAQKVKPLDPIPALDYVHARQKPNASVDIYSIPGFFHSIYHLLTISLVHNS